MRGKAIVLQRTGALAFLALAIPSTEASTALTDPKICYILDGFLLLYSIVITALFFKIRFGQRSANKEDSIYTDLNRSPDTYDQLRSPSDAEVGTMRGNQRRTDDSLYTPLQKDTEDPYRQIAVKKQGRRNKGEQVYQGLSSTTKDTYDSLQMQPLPPPR
ncbi:T-cell surface glycoprotein CD3 zeta chain-like [Scleropages formosus]|uniref:T-cell surface glycoprotein CD3 zeta chain n=1 Tax=Scleropages formosus TaxID=113540 RepID=A0A8C9RGH9_SCLFO|nr:T-cell surface glycoprotein CD3 zeta chain [Scleropages formosus]